MEEECNHNVDVYFDVAYNKRCSNCDEIIEESGINYTAS